MQPKPLAATVDGGFLWRSPKSRAPYLILHLTCEEATTGEINLDADELETLERLFRYMYIEDYCDNQKIKIAAVEDTTKVTQVIAQVPDVILINTKVYIMAENYDVPALMKHAATKFYEVLEEEGQPFSFVASFKLIYESLPESRSTTSRNSDCSCCEALQRTRKTGGLSSIVQREWRDFL